LSGSPVSCMQTMFERHRREVEALASARYDAGQGCPVVTLRDIGQIRVVAAGRGRPLSSFG
jgi:hypothetical protein